MRRVRDPPREVKAAGVKQVCIQEDRAIAGLPPISPLKKLYCFGRAVRQRGAHLAKRKRLFEIVAACRTPIDDQYGESFQVRYRSAHRQLHFVLRGDAEADREVEGASFPRFALNPNPAAHHVNKVFRNREAQPRTAELPGQRAIRLDKGREDRLLLLLGNAAAGIFDGHVQKERVLLHRFRPESGENLAVISELNGVTDQVSKNLSQASWISADDLGKARGQVSMQVQIFLASLRN